jgi:hypothetical protein
MSDKPKSGEQSLDKHSEKATKPVADGAVMSQEDNRLQQLREKRDALAAKRLTLDPNNGFTLDLGGGKAIQDQREIKSTHATSSDATNNSSVENHSKGADRSPLEKLHDFLNAAARRATDPEGWRVWAQSELTKIAGIAVGLNEAKEETKASFSAGLKALTDGTVLEFLSHPDARNRPVFKYVEKVFDAMSKDPEAVNKALEKLGNIVLKASEGYTNLPDYEKGKVIGNVMFAMINPEGATEDGEAVLRLVNKIAHFDKSAATALEQGMKAVEAFPKFAEQTKQDLLDYLIRKGVSVRDLEKDGAIPEGYFEGLSGAGGRWETLNIRESADVVRQSHPLSCVSATGEMLTNGEVSQAELVQKLGTPSSLEHLNEVLGPPWKAGSVTDEQMLQILKHHVPCAIDIGEKVPQHGFFRKELGHVVVIDGLDKDGNIMIRDPAHGERYEMSQRAFFQDHWSGLVMFK